jgi:hypothetical protein
VEYEQTCDILKGKNGVKYEKYLQSLHTIMGKYGKENIVSRGKQIDVYQEQLNIYQKGFSQEINRERFAMYNKLIDENELSPYITSKNKISMLLNKVATDPSSKENPFFGIMYEALEQQSKQMRTDKIREMIKNFSPQFYQIANF